MIKILLNIIFSDAISKNSNRAISFGSGCGKSSLIGIINLLERHASGKIQVDKIDLMSLGPKQLQKKRRDWNDFLTFNLLKSQKCI